MAVDALQPVPLLRTKLFVPRSQQGLVARPRLLQRLDEGLSRTLTLVAAPAGFGKTTLLSAWIAARGQRAAWLSLDEGDSDAARFLSYAIAALQTIEPTTGAGVLSALQNPQAPALDTLLTALINDISALPGQIVLVLDDYHLIDAEPVDRALAFLLDHMPSQLCLVIATREDPPLALARLRARGQLAEVRASDLRFTLGEAVEFLNQVMGLSLTPEDVAALEARTEGWVAGLQLAALSLQGRQDVSGFIQAFAGDHRYIADYLVDEVLRRQPDQVRDFLLQTSILDRLHGSLCDAVTGQQEGDARLESLARGNFFVVPLDDQRQWYRYHHLFADVLRAQLQAEQPGLASTLHGRASAWHERHGSLSEAIGHAFSAGDDSRAADLIERSLPMVRRSRLSATLLRWLRTLPDDVVRRRPVLCVAYATALMSNGELEDVESWLREAERWLDASPGEREQRGGMVVADEGEFQLLPGLIAVYRAGHAYLRGDIPATVTHARQALNLVPEDDHVTRGAAGALLGLAFWTSGDLEAAQREYAAGMESLQRAGMISDVVNGATTVAAISMAQGRLRDAERTLELATQRAVEMGEPSLHGMADFLVGLSELRRERNDLNAAREHLLRARDLALGSEATHNRARWCVAMALIERAHGDLDGTLSLLDEAEHQPGPDFFPKARPVPSLRARIWIAQGRPKDALRWARERGLTTGDELSYPREHEHITLARALLAQAASDPTDGDTRHASELFQRLLQAAEAGGRMGAVIEILALQALAHRAHDDGSAALAALERALALAEPEGYVRVFVDEGEPMQALLEACVQRGIEPGYVRLLLSAFGAEGGESSEPTEPIKVRQSLIEPLSERELDVLRLLATDLDGPEIARELNVTLNTMRTHTKNIYSKLGVNNRRAAVRRAEELGLLRARNR